MRSLPIITVAFLLFCCCKMWAMEATHISVKERWKELEEVINTYTIGDKNDPINLSKTNYILTMIECSLKEYESAAKEDNNKELAKKIEAMKKRMIWFSCQMDTIDCDGNQLSIPRNRSLVKCASMPPCYDDYFKLDQYGSCSSDLQFNMG